MNYLNLYLDIRYNEYIKNINIVKTLGINDQLNYLYTTNDEEIILTNIINKNLYTNILNLKFSKYRVIYFLTLLDNCLLIIKKYKEIKILTLITPCSRPNNLREIFKSINMDYIKKWIIVHDSIKQIKIFNHKDIIEVNIKNKNSIVGNAQRNYALSLIDNNSLVYFLDDDNIIHNNLYKLLNIIESGYHYTFDQERYPNESKLSYFPGNFEHIDTAMFIVDYNLCSNLKWIIDVYDADGRFFNTTKKSYNTIYINTIMAYYNKLISH